MVFVVVSEVNMELPCVLLFKVNGRDMIFSFLSSL